MMTPRSLVMLVLVRRPRSQLTTADMPTENETEVSFFNRQLYDEFKRHPEVQVTSTYNKV